MIDILGSTVASLGWVLFIWAAIYIFVNSSSSEEAKDERDDRIEMRANQIAYYSLVLCVVAVISFIAINGSTLHLSVFGAMEITAMLNAHILLFSLLLTTAIKALTQLFLYRRGE